MLDGVDPLHRETVRQVADADREAEFRQFARCDAGGDLAVQLVLGGPGWR
jgi:hypothetical protein